MNDIARGGVILCVGLSIVFSAIYFPKALTGFDDTASNNASLSYSDREVAGGNGIVADQEAAYQARALIPQDAKYRVVTGSALKNPQPLTLAFVETWYRYFLMPRRPAADARWIICYGCEVSNLGRPYSILWQDDDGISIGRLQ